MKKLLLLICMLLSLTVFSQKRDTMSVDTLMVQLSILKVKLDNGQFVYALERYKDYRIEDDSVYLYLIQYFLEIDCEYIQTILPNKKRKSKKSNIKMTSNKIN